MKIPTLVAPTPSAAILVLLFLAPLPTLSENVRLELALEGDSQATGHLFFSYEMSGEQAAAHALVVAGSGTGHGGELLGSYGIRQMGDEDVIGALDSDALAELAHTQGARAGSLTATINAEQLAAITEILEAAKDEPLTNGKDTAFENVVYRVLSKIPVKAPFRGSFAAGDPYQLVHDIVRINNK